MITEDCAKDIARSLPVLELHPLRRVRAIEIISGIRGGSNPQIVVCDDGAGYVVKFQNNDQGGGRILANDLLATRLAELLGLPVAPSAIVDVSGDLIRRSASARIHIDFQADFTIPCQPGLCFGSQLTSRWCMGEFTKVFDTVSNQEFEKLRNKRDFLGMLVFDTWTANADCRQVVYVRDRWARHCRAVMIDQGHCFGVNRWEFSDSATPALQWTCRRAYVGATIADFEPWLSRLENDVSLDDITQLASEIPPEWYAYHRRGLAYLIELLDQRRSIVRDLLKKMVSSHRYIVGENRA